MSRPTASLVPGTGTSLSPPALPEARGLALVTASALGESSVPTYVFVHPHVDSVTVTGVLLDGVPVQEPCLSQGQSMTLEAHAFSQGSDVTSSVGPFTFSAQNPSVVNLGGSRQHRLQLRHESNHCHRRHSRNDPDLRIGQRSFQFVFSSAAISEFAGNHFASP